MPTLRLTLFDKNFTVLDRSDIAVPGEDQRGAGEAMKAVKSHLWENHFSADLDPLLASRANLLERLDELLTQVEGIQKDGIINWNLTSFKAAVQEGRMMNDLALPDKYKKELEEKYGRKSPEIPF